MELTMNQTLVESAAKSTSSSRKVDELAFRPSPEATLGGAETMYPEFRKKVKDKFVMPAKCTLNCGGPARPAQ